MPEINSKEVIELRDHCNPHFVWVIGENLISIVRGMRDPHGHTMWSAGNDAIERAPGRLLNVEIIASVDEDRFDYAMINPKGEIQVLGSLTLAD